jgi:hypothetical protein
MAKSSLWNRSGCLPPLILLQGDMGTKVRVSTALGLLVGAKVGLA